MNHVEIQRSHRPAATAFLCCNPLSLNAGRYTTHLQALALSTPGSSLSLRLQQGDIGAEAPSSMMSTDYNSLNSVTMRYIEKNDWPPLIQAQCALLPLEFS